MYSSHTILTYLGSQIQIANDPHPQLCLKTQRGSEDMTVLAAGEHAALRGLQDTF